MDLPAHVFWSLALFKKYNWAWQGVFFGILPDLIFAIPVAFYWLKSGRKTSYGDLFPKIEPYYRFAHSAVTMLFFFAIFSLANREPYWPLLAGWGLHILLDLPFHRGGFVQGIALLHPISKRKINGKWWWKEIVEKRPWILLVNYALAALVYFFA